MPDLPDTIQVGLKHERRWVVADYMLYAPGGDPSRNTLSSPSMINEMETTAMLSIDHLLPQDGYTVGFHVDIKHVAPAIPGSRVKTTTELLEINETRFRFHVEARDIATGKLIGIGTHRRAAIFP